jgi:hypothetical protein
MPAKRISGDLGNRPGPQLLLSPYDLDEGNFEVVSVPQQEKP